MWLQATRSNHKMDDNLYHPCMVYLPTFVVDFYGQCRWISIHGILCEWFLFKPYLQASMSIKPEEPPSLELIFYFASENSPWFLLTTFDTTWFLLGTKNNRPQNGPQCFGGFHSRHCNPKCISTLALLHQGKYEDAEQVKSGSWVQLRKISKFWGATSRCAAIYESGTIWEALWKWQEGCFLKVKWRLMKVKLCMSHVQFFVDWKDAQFQGKNSRYQIPKSVDFFQTHQSIHMGVS